MKIIISLAVLAFLGHTSAISLENLKDSDAKNGPEMVDKYHGATMRDAADMENIRNRNIKDQEAADVWRGKKGFVQRSVYGDDNIDQATADKMYETTMAIANDMESKRTIAINSQELKDEWRGNGTKTA